MSPIVCMCEGGEWKNVRLRDEGETKQWIRYICECVIPFTPSSPNLILFIYCYEHSPLILFPRSSSLLIPGISFFLNNFRRALSSFSLISQQDIHRILHIIVSRLHSLYLLLRFIIILPNHLIPSIIILLFLPPLQYIIILPNTHTPSPPSILLAFLPTP